LPGNPTKVLRAVLAALLRDDQLRVDLADIPTVRVDTPLDSPEIEKTLREGLQSDAGTLEAVLERELSSGSVSAAQVKSYYAELARRAAGILSERLPSARLANAKEAELSSLTQNQYVMIESEWRVTRTKTEAELRLRTLRSIASDGVVTRSVKMPEHISIRVPVPVADLDARAKERLSDGTTVAAAVFAEVLSASPTNVGLWPIAVVTRSPGKAAPAQAGWRPAPRRQSADSTRD
jgi:hypothetical protein